MHPPTPSTPTPPATPPRQSVAPGSAYGVFQPPSYDIDAGVPSLCSSDVSRPTTSTEGGGEEFQGRGKGSREMMMRDLVERLVTNEENVDDRGWLEEWVEMAEGATNSDTLVEEAVKRGWGDAVEGLLAAGGARGGALAKLIGLATQNKDSQVLRILTRHESLRSRRLRLNSPSLPPTSDSLLPRRVSDVAPTNWSLSQRPTTEALDPPSHSLSSLPHQQRRSTYVGPYSLSGVPEFALLSGSGLSEEEGAAEPSAEFQGLTKPGPSRSLSSCPLPPPPTPVAWLDPCSSTMSVHEDYVNWSCETKIRNLVGLLDSLERREMDLKCSLVDATDAKVGARDLLRVAYGRLKEEESKISDRIWLIRVLEGEVRGVVERLNDRVQCLKMLGAAEGGTKEETERGGGGGGEGESNQAGEEHQIPRAYKLERSSSARLSNLLRSTKAMIEESAGTLGSSVAAKEEEEEEYEDEEGSEFPVTLRGSVSPSSSSSIGVVRSCRSTAERELVSIISEREDLLLRLSTVQSLMAATVRPPSKRVERVEMVRAPSLTPPTKVFYEKVKEIKGKEGGGGGGGGGGL
ncbi:hypothetical protein TrCOL_g11015 [Triparma columacea]|uniref:Uncharacterized protein n=1 Tax=Triparma columacea TaxID=722753 RepID=A0A9W7L8Z9_9STRA|nr:hypothetical protein TrCOL_g11015 [Triparma columacea]